MKAILLRRPGEPSALEYVDVPTQRPSEGEVLVKPDTIGISMPEVLVRKVVYAWMPPLPAIPGIELAGTIIDRGAGTTGPAIGHGPALWTAKIEGQLIAEWHLHEDTSANRALLGLKD
jgi:NADPH2:quinone reductase